MVQTPHTCYFKVITIFKSLFIFGCPGFWLLGTSFHLQLAGLLLLQSKGASLVVARASLFHSMWDFSPDQGSNSMAPASK